MGHGCAQAFGRCFFQVPEHSVDAAYIDPRMVFGNSPRPLPALLVALEPSALLCRE
ncbi:MAG TPA: hypothetical protein VHV51_00105 [Polyangiaceae bacterium]|jgi:hypothetical protein|nr:hypothetical protein [Polyangiaceae bacterium]